MPFDPEPKPKRSFKMPSIKLSKHIKTFGLLMPVCGSSVSIGMVYDTSLLGWGLKWGCSLSLGLVAVFFAILAFNNAESREHG